MKIKITQKEFMENIIDAIESNAKNEFDDKSLISYARYLVKAYKGEIKIKKFPNISELINIIENNSQI